MKTFDTKLPLSSIRQAILSGLEQEVRLVNIWADFCSIAQYYTVLFILHPVVLIGYLISLVAELTVSKPQRVLFIELSVELRTCMC